ncbi:MAG: DHH family phosphoesterase [Flavobacteriales bacterium]
MAFIERSAAALADLRTQLAGPKRCVIVTHQSPDGDAMGSTLAMAALLRSAGHQAQVLAPDPAPPFLGFLPGIEHVLDHRRNPVQCTEAIATADLILVLDLNRLDRTGGMEQLLRSATVPRVLIDHHQDPEEGFAISFSDTSSCATCALVADLARAMGWEQHVDRAIATCLYTGLVTDTGSFRFRSTDGHTMRTAGWLMDFGVDIEQVHQAIQDDNTESRLRLLGLLLSERMTILREERTVILTLNKEDLDRHHHQQGDTEGFVNYGLSLRGMRLSAYFMERTDGVKLSLRSKGNLAVDRFLREHFDGGGHVNAAGGRYAGTIEQAVAHFRGLLPALLAQYPA